MFVKLNIREHNSVYADHYETDVIIDIIDPALQSDTDTAICNAFQSAYDEYYATLDYASDEEAENDGVCFGSCFSDIPSSITRKHGFLILEPKEFFADYDYGFKK